MFLACGFFLAVYSFISLFCLCANMLEDNIFSLGQTGIVQMDLAFFLGAAFFSL